MYLPKEYTVLLKSSCLTFRERSHQMVASKHTIHTEALQVTKYQIWSCRACLQQFLERDSKGFQPWSLQTLSYELKLWRYPNLLLWRCRFSSKRHFGLWYLDEEFSDRGCVWCRDISKWTSLKFVPQKKVFRVNLWFLLEYRLHRHTP